MQRTDTESPRGRGADTLRPDIPGPGRDDPASAPSAREIFPVTREYAYFNHAAIAPLPRPTADAMQAQVDDAMRLGVHAFARWEENCAELRRASATMLGCQANEIAITKNTSEGLCAVANGLDWRTGDVVVGLASDFPANYVPWRALQSRRGVQFRGLRMREGALDLEDLDQACKGARLAALSYVHFLTGFRWDLKAAGEICERRGCALVVDAVQGMGPFPVDVKACGIHALSASGHKWLLGPEGCALFYIDRDWMPLVEPTEMGWASLDGFERYRSDGGLHASARRFECGTLNSAGCAGLRASVDLLNGIGPRAASTAIHALAERLLDGARGKGYEPAAARSRANGSGIVSLRKQGVDPPDTVAMLLDRRVSVAERLGWIRAAPHFYNTSGEVDRLVELLP